MDAIEEANKNIRAEIERCEQIMKMTDKEKEDEINDL